MTTLDPRQHWRRTTRTGNPSACKTMHPLHARLKNREIAEKWHKKTGIHGTGLGLVLSRLLAAQCANNTIEAHAGNNQQKNRRPRIFINER
ncbi:hypothetical protein P5782_002917 [Salmonella enterica]|uniref:hypothetical protein n=1 Tax=Salmonella TaxID=590 RepID=UPI0002694D5B|nr:MULTISPECIES: hypothetical protein [Salmonella]EDZ3178073.1 hypothetical protein [Salmonella enterica]EEO7475787.1 hypothetical protein [Salmonella enterica subsp. diarizonae]EEP8422727.1 hypothetical protein [Salmonella enterica subsp. enterica serovar Bareilly]EGB5720178.1 hypothetical protein [Salmonella enterica subsp. enterica serovar Abony]EGJ3126987.1 hypothetical protein [Salmonella enterica subsp. enterica serovar Thompson]EGL2177736.1 hypothetical protein [Salmonella enterica sub